MGNIPVNLILKGDKIKARVVKSKQLVNTRLAANYGGWMYCDQCNENIGYLCYATYDLTNLATLKDWPVVVTVVDLVWGTSVTAAVSVLTVLTATYFKWR